MSDDTDLKLQNVSGNQQPAGVSNHSTPIQSKKPTAFTQDVNDAFSPFFSQYTQEENENTVDVMWDWYSPQSKPRVRKINKCKSDQESPKLPIKRQPSNNQIDGFNKLREELETLRDNIVESTDASALPNAKHSEVKYNLNITNLEDVFNDSMDEQLLVCSQEAEDICLSGKLVSKDQSLKYFDKTLHSQEHVEKVLCSKASVVQVMTHNNNEENKTYNMNKIADDSLDFILETLKDEDLEINEPFIATDERGRETNCNSIQNKDQFTAKASHSSLHAQDNALKCTAQEIEKKRKEALSKLEVKKKQIAYEVTVHKCATQETEQKNKEAFIKLPVKQKEVAYENESPIKCSPEEIEQKRLQAIAKLEAKKKQDIIERNRQEALRRLEENKRKRALLGQTSLPRKIHNANI